MVFQDYVVELFDAAARRQHVRFIQTGSCKVADVASLSPGVYIARLIDIGAEKIYVGKLIVE